MKREEQLGLADLTNVNLAYVLSDAQKIYIPSINDKGKDIDEPAQIVTESANQKSNSQEDKRVININIAEEEDLQKIPGIGSTIAKRIITYRKQNGAFKSIEEIKNVSGIGESKFNKIKQYICVK